MIGRLVTDERFRQMFQTDPRQALAGLLEIGTELTQAEVDALAATDGRVWERVADEIDSRLQKASLKP